MFISRKELIFAFLVFDYMFVVNKVKQDRHFFNTLLLVGPLLMMAAMLGPFLYLASISTLTIPSYINYLLVGCWTVAAWTSVTLFLADLTLSEDEEVELQEAILEKLHA